MSLRDEVRANLQSLQFCAPELSAHYTEELLKACDRAETKARSDEVVKAEMDRLTSRVQELEYAIKYHASQQGDDRCFLDDLMLYRLIGINKHPGLALPKEDFLAGCSRYWECQQTGTTYIKTQPQSARDDAAEILETIAKEGLPGPRDLDVALDAIECCYNVRIEDED